MKFKTYVFVFTGEFGYELLNWQGRIRKFSKETPDSRIICASLKATKILYEDFSEFIALDESEIIKNGIADSYFLRYPNFRRDGFWDVLTAYRRRRTLKKFIVQNFPRISLKNTKFIFSDQPNNLEGFLFGATRWAPRINPLRRRSFQEIYDNIPVEENLFKELVPSETTLKEVGQKIKELGITGSFIAIQNAERDTFLKRRRFEFSTSELFHEVSNSLPTLEISFRQVRETDTQSPTASSEKVYVCRSLEEQAAVIRLSSFCIFFSSGDYRSLHYVPSFCGKDNYSISSSSIISNSAIGLWNSKIFNFGGKIIPMTTESLIFDQKFKNNFLDFCISRL
jgi:hypothetical protein